MISVHESAIFLSFILNTHFFYCIYRFLSFFTSNIKVIIEALGTTFRSCFKEITYLGWSKLTPYVSGLEIYPNEF